MTIPNITMTWCNRIAKCEWCPENINAGEPLVTVFFWNKGSPEHKGFNVKKYYHPDCWVAQGLDYLKRNPYSPYIRKVKMELTPEQAEHRYVLLRRKAAIDQRIRKLADVPNRIMVEARLKEHITEIMLEIAPIGGIPKKWLE